MVGGAPLFIPGGNPCWWSSRIAKSPAQTAAAAVGNVAIRHWEPDEIRHTPPPSSANPARLATRVAKVGAPM